MRPAAIIGVTRPRVSTMIAVPNEDWNLGPCNPYVLLEPYDAPEQIQSITFDSYLGSGTGLRIGSPVRIIQSASI
jgi:hypothetical protein